MEIRLIIDKVKLALLKRAKVGVNKKSRAAWIGKGYCNLPEVTVVIQCHNKSLQVLHILPKLRKYAGFEIIVVDDGSDNVHTRRLAKALKGPNEFLLRCNDLYENITYDRSLRLANGKYVALLQDDDDFDDNCKWINAAVSLFKSHPGMVILGGKGGYDITFDADGHTFQDADMTHGDFCFVAGVNRAPMWINRELYSEKLKNIDFDFAPFQYDDYELCFRAWLNGLTVGWYDARFRSLSAGGMRLWNQSFTKEQMQRNSRLLFDKYHDKMDEIKNKVKEAEETIEKA